MLIYIESYWGDRLISGKKSNLSKLREMCKKVTEATETEEFTTVFCRMFQFEELPLDESIQVDFVIDLDTHLVYIPRY